MTDEREVIYCDMEKKGQEPIDVQKMALLLLARKRFIAKVCGVMLFIAIIFAYSQPRGYHANVILAPEASNSSLLSGGVGALAAAAGVSLRGSSEDAIYPEIYPDLISSPQFLVDLFDIRVKSADGSIDTTLYAYYEKYQKAAWWSYGILAVKMGIKKLINTSSGTNRSDSVDVFWMTEKQHDICQAIKSNMTCMVDRKTGVITLGYSAQDPLVAALMADSVKQKLQDYIVRYRTCKARNDLSYFEKLCEEARLDYIKAQQAYASFSDQNNEIYMQSYAVKKNRLENEALLAQEAYGQMVQQVQMARAKVQEKTPAFTVLSAATVPLKPSSPKRMFIMIGFILVGFLGASVYVYCKDLMTAASKTKEKD